MLASALGVVIVSLVSGLLTFISMIVMVVSLASGMDKEETVTVRNNTFVTVDLSKISGDRTGSSLKLSLGEGKTVGLISAIEAIRNAANDDKVSGLFIKDNGAAVSWASLEELRGAIEEFRQSGKPVVAYATTYSQPGYYLATASDVISLHPAGMVEFHGMGGEVLYYKDLLDKLGVEMQLIRPESCAYKSAGEVYTLNHMSDANREQIRAYIGSIWNTATSEIATSRNISVSELNTIADNLSGFLADDACAQHLVDTLCFEEDVRAMLKEQYGGKHLLSILIFAKGSRQICKGGSEEFFLYGG